MVGSPTHHAAKFGGHKDCGSGDISSGWRARFFISEGSCHIDTSVCDKSVKLSELHYNVTGNDFFNRGTLHRHVGTDVNIFWLPSIFLKTYVYVNLYNVGTAI